MGYDDCMNSDKRWRLAVYWLSAAFLITGLSLAAYAGTVHHARKTEEERSALLFASDLLALRDSRAEQDGMESVYLALLESRIPQLKQRQDSESLAAALRTETADTLAAETEEALRQGVYSSAFLYRLLAEVSVPSPMTEKNSTADAVPLRPFGETDAAEASRKLLDLRFLQNAACQKGKTAFCRNAYVSFDGKGRTLQAYAVSFVPGAAVLDEHRCREYALRFVRDVPGMRKAEIVNCRIEGSVQFLQLTDGVETALVGVRRDSGSVCFFLRSLKKNGNVLQ